MNILYACDDKFCAYTGISITSLFENNKNLDELNVFIAGQGISNDNKLKLQKTAEKYGRSITIIDAEEIDSLLAENNARIYNKSLAPFYRVFVDKIFPETVSRVLYIDSDSVIVGSLSELDAFTFEADKVCAMKKDPISVDYKKSIGLNEDDVYYHSGVMLFDLDNWRRLKCSDMLLKEIAEGRANYRLPDQDLLSRALNKNIQPLDMKYNFITHIPYFGIDVYRAISEANDRNYYTIQQMQEAVENPVILHTVRGLTGTPWEKGNTNPFRVEWTKYKEISLWSDIGETPGRTGGIVAVQRVLFKILPKQLFISLYKWFSKRKHSGYVKNKELSYN